MGYVLGANDRRFKGLFCEPPFGDNCETDLFEVSAAGHGARLSVGREGLDGETPERLVFVG